MTLINIIYAPSRGSKEERMGILLQMLNFIFLQTTVPFHSIQQSCVMGHFKMLKCHDCHSNFHGVLNSFGNHVTDIEIFSSPAALNCRKMPKILGMSWQLWEVAETKISAGPSCIMGPAELIEMVQYYLDSYIVWLCIPSIPEHHCRHIALLCVTSIPNTQNTAIQLWLY